MLMKKQNFTVKPDRGLSLNNKCFAEGDESAYVHTQPKIRAFLFFNANRYLA